MRSRACKQTGEALEVGLEVKLAGLERHSQDFELSLKSSEESVKGLN
jgi:hypothetical protein